MDIFSDKHHLEIKNMINESDNLTVPYILSNMAQEAYNKIKALIIKIFSLIKKQHQEKNLKEQFRDSYIDFAKKLKEEGHCEESNIYMSICVMYYHLMDRPEVLTAHEGFFNDLFDEFDKLLQCKINNPDDYSANMDEFYIYLGEMRNYFYTTVVIPSDKYDETVLKEIIGSLSDDME